MLVLTRRPNESICIADNIVVKVVSIRPRSVKLAVDAPREIPVHREELRRRIESELRSVGPCGQFATPLRGHDAAETF
jgi:carbon storage regulator